MLSGVGPRDQLGKFGIPEVVNLPGVGGNLQDRYEVGVVSCFERDFALIDRATFLPPDPDPDSYMQQWLKNGTGLYASNGTLIGIIRRSSKELKDPDLYIFGIPGFFRGYYPGYSKLFEYHHNRFTWAILKARTRNTGRVELKSADPRDMPLINFQYFGDGGRASDPDLEAVVNGVQFVRAMNERLVNKGLISSEETPGSAYATPTSCASLSGMRRGAIMRPAPARSAPMATKWRFLTADSKCGEPSACGWWMRLCFRKFRAISSSLRFT